MTLLPALHAQGRRIGALLLACLGMGLALQPVQAAPATHAGSGDAAAQEALQAYRAQQMARLDWAEATMRSHPLLPYVRYWKVRLLPNDPDIQAFLHQYPQGPLAEQLRIDWIRGLARRADWALLAAAATAVADPPDDIACWHARARLGLGELDRAQILLQDQWRRWDALPESCIDTARDLAAQGRIGVDVIWQRARHLVGMDLAMAARRTLSLLPADQRPSPQQMDLALGLPERWLKTGDAWGRSRRVKELTSMALVRVASNNPEQANRLMSRFMRRVEPRLRGYVNAQIGLQAARRLDDQAHQWFALAGVAELTDEHRAWWARSALRAGQWSAVRTAVEGMSAWARMEPRWQYWQGRAESALGHEAVAQALWRGAARDQGFYGRLAREALGQPLQPDRIDRPGRSAVAAIAQDPGIARAVALHKLGLSQDASKEWAWASRRFDEQQLAAAAAHARDLQLWNRVIDSAERMHPGHALALRYPAPYRDVVRQASQRFDVDEALVYGVIHQESRFSSAATSNKGARGLMQIMPDTARWLVGELGWPDGETADALADPRRSILMGTRYLRQLESDLGGSRVLAAAAYNAGPGRAIAWRGDRPIEGAVYAESIPFAETRDYVQRVMAASVHYAEMLGGQPQRLKAYIGVVPPNRSATTRTAAARAAQPQQVRLSLNARETPPLR